MKGAEKPVSGILFTHGPQGIPECLDISMSTTGYEEGDADFPLCLGKISVTFNVQYIYMANAYGQTRTINNPIMSAC